MEHSFNPKSVEVLEWALQLIWALGAAFGIFVVRTLRSDIDRSRESIKEIYTRLNADEIAAANAKTEAAQLYAPKDAVQEMETRIMDRFDKFEERFDKVLERMGNGQARMGL